MENFSFQSGFERIERRNLPDVVRELVPDCKALVEALWPVDFVSAEWDLKQTSVRGGTKLSGRNMNLENVSKVSVKQMEESHSLSF